MGKGGRPHAAEVAELGVHVQRGRRVLEIEARAVADLARRLGGEFERAVEEVAACRGKVVVTGMGKSGIVCRKIASTLASTGTPAFFLHAAEALHGDLGMLVRGDLVLAVSNSGETEELIRLLPVIKRLSLPLIAVTGNPESNLARRADVVLDVSVAEEACPLGLAPTASTTATVALGDALAVALLEHKGFRPEDFAALHPGGALGRRLLKVSELMHVGAEIPLVREGTSMREVVLEMTSKRLGVTGVVNEAGRLVGVITDGDLRRGLERRGDILALTAGDLMTRNPKVVEADTLGAKAVAVMEAHAITSLFIVDEDGLPAGIIHLHDLLKAGVV